MNNQPAFQPQAPGSIRIENLRREYAEHTALDGVDLVVQPGEFLTLLGPSGSGKSTLLHLIAGLGEASGGRIFIDEKDVTELPAQKRNIGLVFQSYALFPHLTARQNIEFPLTVEKGRSQPERAARVEEILELVHLTAQADRHPSQMSGGQQQRVAVGRALSGSPRVLLLDEPLGALDRKLRHQLGRDLRRIQQETSVTTVYVTHDQEEAFLMSDRIAIMNNGQLQQIGTPEEIYHHPRTPFVASFIGEINLLPLAVSGGRRQLTVGTPADDPDSRPEALDLGQRIDALQITNPVVGIRPESVKVSGSAAELQRQGLAVLGAGQLVERVFQGSVVKLTIDIGAEQMLLALDYSGEIGFVTGDVVHLGVRDSNVLILEDSSDT